MEGPIYLHWKILRLKIQTIVSIDPVLCTLLEKLFVSDARRIKISSANGTTEVAIGHATFVRCIISLKIENGQGEEL